MLKDYEELDFDVLNEDWNEYEIENKDKLKVKFVMIKIIRKKIPGGYNYAFNGNNVIGIFSPKIREPGEPIFNQDEILKSIINFDMKYEPIKEVWNKYLIKKDKSIIEVKIVITDIQKSDKIDEYGNPYYLIKIEPVFKGGRPTKTH
jgi:hypothetical protein